MYYSQFSKQLKETLQKGETKEISPSPVHDYIELLEEIEYDFFHDNVYKIANLIKEEHDIKVTNNIVEQYIELAINKTFSIDPVIHQIREMNNFDSPIDGKIHYILEDGSKIAINYETQGTINTILSNNLKAVEFMRESSENFLKILSVIIKE